MPTISSLVAREILDSKGDPTIEVEITLSDGSKATDSVPSGASTGAYEAVELHDSDPQWYAGQGVQKAVANVNQTIAASVVNQPLATQRDLDNLLLTLDGTPNKSKLGANAILAVSLSFARATAVSQKKELYQYIGDLSGVTQFTLPQPMILIMEGGKHGNWSTDIQEYMIRPIPGAFKNFSTALEASNDVFQALEKILQDNLYSTGVGFEGAFCPQELKSNDEAFDLICQAIKKASYSYPEQFVIAIDCAASEFYREGKYHLSSEGGTTYDPAAWLEKIVSWTQKYPIFSVEDPFDQNEWDSWTTLVTRLGPTHQVVGDDLTVTNVDRIQTAIDRKAINSTLIKLNQIGTVSETIDAINITKKAGFTSVISHRSGETIDDFSADFVVGSGSSQCKFGGPNRGERISKYNRLLKISYALTGQ